MYKIYKYKIYFIKYMAMRGVVATPDSAQGLLLDLGLEITPGRDWGSFGIVGIKCWSTMNKANVVPIVLALQNQEFWRTYSLSLVNWFRFYLRGLGWGNPPFCLIFCVQRGELFDPEKVATS